MIKVLILFSSSELGGAERSLSRMAFASTEIAYELATLEADGPWCEWIRARGVNPIILGSKGPLGSGSLPAAFFRLFRFLRTNPVDIVYVCGIRAALWLRLCRFFMPGTKIVHGVRWNPESDRRLDVAFRFVERATHRLIDGWITNSQVTKNTIIERCGISEDKVQVIYNGIDALLSDIPPLDARPMEVLTVANLNPRKGHREFLSIAKKVRQKIPHCQFVFVGRDDMSGEVQRSIESEGLAGIVSYQGFQADVAPWLRRARLFVLPSLWGEGCPTSILEAFSYGIPVIAHAIDGVPELVDDGKDGYLLSVGDEKMAEYIIELLLHPEISTKMGSVGRQKVADRFVLTACANQHEAVFKKLLEA